MKHAWKEWLAIVVLVVAYTVLADGCDADLNGHHIRIAGSTRNGCGRGGGL